MTRKFTFLLMALLALAGFKSWAQMDVVIGTGTSTSSSTPFNSFYNYSYNEILYGADEIGTAGTINAISFQTTTETTFKTYVLDIYMKNVTRTSFASATDWEKVSSSDLVCQTTMPGSQTGWVTFTLDTPFEYDGESSLMIAVDNNTGGYAQKYFYYTLASGKEHGGYQDSGDIDPTNPAATNTQNNGYRPNIKINITPTGLASHTITYVQPDNGTVSGPAEAYEGQTVILTATPDANYALGQFFVNGSPIEGNTFTMPTSNVTVTATFVYHPTLTVYDGTNTNSYVPIYGSWADSQCKSQFIMPSADLEGMYGGTISGMTFYLTHEDYTFTGTWKVYLKEVDYTTLSGYVDWSTLGDGVYTGNMTIAGNKMTVNFDTPFTYNEGNLLIGFNETNSGGYSGTSWFGVNQTDNTAYAGYGTNNYTYKFLPKTTFDYMPDPNRHNITVTQPVEGGEISASRKMNVLPGTVVTLTATPELGYTLGEWIVTDADGGTVDVTDNSFEMPAKDITVTATFESAGEMYTITLPDLDPEIISGIDALYNGESASEAPEGTEITLVYETLNIGYIFNNWTLNGEAIDGNTFTMPASNAVIDINLTERPRYAVIIDESIVNGTVEANPNTDILGGTQVTLTITPDTYYRLASLTVTDGSGDPVTVTNNKFSMPESNATVTATFEYHPTLTVNDGTAVNTNNSTGQVPFNGYNADNYNNKSQFIIPASALEPMIDATITDITFYLNNSSSNKEYTSDNFDIYVKEVDYTAVNYTYPEDFANMTNVYSGKLTTSNYQLKIHFDTPFVYGGQNLMIGFNQTTHGTWGYTYWLGKEEGTEMRSRSGYGPSTVNSYKFLPKITFDFTPGEHRYNITTVSDPVAGGTVTTDPADKAAAGTTVALSATPNFGYEFVSWSVKDADEQAIDVTSNSFVMPEKDVTVTATFALMDLPAITFVGIDDEIIEVAATYGGETIEVAPAGTEVTLEYTNLNEGYTFNYWTLNGEQLTGNTFTMPATDVEIGVNLSERPRYAVSIDGSITNGTITANPSTNILGNTTVTLTITPATGYGLGELTVTDGSGDPVTVTNNQFAMPESNVTVTATFIPMLTVYDGTATQYYAPVYTYYGDTEGSASQFMVPASLLEDMQGGTINSMKFYISSSERLGNLETASYKGYIKEINSASMNNTFIFDDAANIFDGTLSLTNNNTEMLITFSEPYTYNGGNLVIAFECTESEGAWTKLNYYSSSATGGIIYRNGSATSTNTSNYVPKTTFYYTPGEVVYYDIDMHVNGVVTEETLRAGRTLQAPTENIPAGLTFCGWTTTDIETYTDVAPAYQTKVTEVTDLYAVFSYSEMGGATTWTKVTESSELQNGDNVVIAAMNGENTGYTMNESCEFTGSATCSALPATFGNSGATIAALPEGTTQFTVALDPIYSSQFSLVGESGNKLVYWEGNLNVPTGAVPDYTNDLFYFDYGGLIWSGYDDDYNDLYLILHNYDSYGGTNMRFGIDEISAGWTYAAYLYKPQGTLTTYYMTEALTDGTVAESTSTKNIIITGTHSVNVASGARLEMNEGGLFRNENTANFVFADGAQFYYTGEESVNATFEKDITGYTGDNDNYYLIANPTDEDEVAHLTDNSFDIFTFNPGAALEWKNQHDNAVIEQGTGYLYANSEDVTLQFAGELMPAGETTLTLVKAADGTGLDYPGFNLVGNPFACDAYIDGSFYRMNGTEFVSVANGPISPCEGIFVEASEDGEELAITTTAASKGANLELTLSQGRSAVIDRAIVRFDESNDMHKFMMNPAHTNIRLAKNGQEFAAVSSEAEGEIPVSFMAEKDGSYTISVNTENVNAHYIHLIDNMTGMDTDLLSTPSYTFNASTSDYAYRFKLVFNVEIGEANGNNGDSDNFAFMSNGNLVINGIEGEATMQIVDVLGRVVSTEIVSGSYNKALNLRAGLYIINLNGMTQKIVVK